MAFVQMDRGLLKPAGGGGTVAYVVEDYGHACPTCKADGGEVCRTAKGVPLATRVHTERRYQHDLPF